MRRNGARRVRGEGLRPLPHRDSVQGFLEYCRLRAFRRPENDDYGWARLAQVISNFMGADGTSIGIDDVKCLDMQNGDNGVYLMKDWKIVGRRFYDSDWEQNEYGLQEFLHYLDETQPVGQQLGKDMIDCLLYHGKVISDVSWNYSYEMNKRAEEGKMVEGFHVGRYYSSNVKDSKSYMKVVDKTTMEVIMEIDGEERKLPKFKWRDGSESTIVMNDYGRELTVSSANEVIA